jgi:2'-5' RNA ligase
MMRLFIAMPLPEKIEELLAEIIFDLKQIRSKVKWVTPKNIHLTLKFLGDTDEKKIPEIIEAIKKIGSDYKMVISEINKLGAFPNLRRPRVIWAGLDGSIDILAEIAGKIENEMEKAGFEKENRPFKSHLTLGRVKDNFGIADLTQAIEKYDFAPEQVVFDRIVLFKSTLTRQGPIYERLFETELQT